MSTDRFRFRVWDVEKRIMHYDAEETYDFMHGKPVIMENCFGDLINNCDYILEQCTGLKDKNGKLIYEGDVISRNNGRWKEIRFYQGGFGWWTEYYCFVSFSGHNYLEEVLQTHEIIGNIHEMEDVDEN